MATAAQYGQLALHLLNKRIDFVNDTINVALHKTRAPVQATDDFYDDTVAATNEVTGTGYPANGVALSGKSVTYDSTTRETRAIAANTSFGTLTIAAGPQYAIIHDRTPATDATRPLMSWVNFGSAQNMSGVAFSINWDATGVFKFTAGVEA